MGGEGYKCQVVCKIFGHLCQLSVNPIQTLSMFLFILFICIVTVYSLYLKINFLFFLAFTCRIVS